MIFVTVATSGVICEGVSNAERVVAGESMSMGLSGMSCSDLGVWSGKSTELGWTRYDRGLGPWGY